MQDLIHIKVKTAYATEVINDLVQKNAIEILEEEIEIPEWQIAETRRRIKKYEANPELFISLEEAKKMLH